MSGALQAADGETFDVTDPAPDEGNEGEVLTYRIVTEPTPRQPEGCGGRIAQSLWLGSCLLVALLILYGLTRGISDLFSLL